MECKRCGTCCQKGGPALHKEDLAILERGVIGPDELITFRKGEPAFHPKRQELIPLPSEMIKIKGLGLTGRCIFFDESRCACTIYDDRPLECRLLKCWDTAAIEEVFLKDLLVRADLFGLSPVIMELIAAHERAFPLGSILASGPDSIRQAAEDERRFRRLVSEKYGLDEASMLLILGREIAAVAGSNLIEEKGPADQEKNEC